MIFKDIADISGALYKIKPDHPRDFPVPEGMEVLEVKINRKTGFLAAAFKKGDEILIGYKATDFNKINDLWTDFQIAVLGKKPGQFKDAIEFYREVAQKHGKGKEIILNGVSLGGALAQYVGAITGRTTITYNSAPIAHFFKGRNPAEFKNIHNVVVKNDPISNMRKQLGHVSYIDGPIININPNSNKFLKGIKRFLNIGNYADAHFTQTVYRNPAAKPFLNIDVKHIDSVNLWGLTSYHKNHPEVCGVWQAKRGKKALDKTQVNINPVVAKISI